MDNNFTFNPISIALKPFFEQMISADPEFSAQVESKKDKKNFNELCEYVYGEAYNYAKEHKDGNCGLSFCDDASMESLIRHYYDEDDIKITKVTGATASVSAVKTPKAEKKAENADNATKKADSKPITTKVEKETAPTKKESKKAVSNDEGFDLFGCAELWS